MKQAFFVLFFLLFGLSEGRAIEVKIASFDTLIRAKWTSKVYLSEYKNGIDMAIERYQAKNPDVTIKVKYFKYDCEKALDILKVAPKVKEWKPTAIIGPRRSKEFLLLKDFFPDILVISPLATAEDVYKMPKNFYSITPKNSKMAITLAHFIKSNFKFKRIYPIVELDCRYCVDFYDEFKNAAHQIGIKTVNSNANYVYSNMESIKIKDLLGKYKPGDAFLLPNSTNPSGMLMGKISEYLNDDSLLFFGGDGWGSQVTRFGEPWSKKAFSGYRLTSWSLEFPDDESENFKKKYLKKYKTMPEHTIPIISFKAMNTIKPKKFSTIFVLNC